VRVLMAIATIAAIVRIVRQIKEAQEAEAERAPGWRGPTWLRHWVTERFNPLIVRYGLVGGEHSPWAFVEHVGRKSGMVRRTPILPHVSGDHVVVPLPYGRNVHWARNVLAAGHCRMQLHAQVYELDEPQVLPASEVEEMPGWRRSGDANRGVEYLRLRFFGLRPGTLDTVEAREWAEKEEAPTVAVAVESAKAEV
jgi:deazaflavin-dependent oxidoreductase (nitroreductase family)